MTTSNQKDLKIIECLAAIAWAPGQPLTLEKVQVAKPGKGQVRIKTTRTGICFSDIAMWNGVFPGVKFPCILGHESSAVVESIGEGVTTVKRGDLVLTMWAPEAIRREETAKQGILCNHDFEANVSRISCRGQKIYVMGPVASFSEYCVVTENCLLKLDPKAPVETIAPFSCSVPMGYGAVKTIAKVRPKSTVFIWGLGVVGLSLAMACREMGAWKIVGVDTSATKLNLAKKFGCTDTINLNEEAGRVKEVALGEGADYAFVCFGHKKTIDEALEVCRHKHGLTVIIGFLEKIEKLESDDNFINARDLTWTSTWCGAHGRRQEVEDLVKRYLRGDLIEADYMTTHFISLEQINEGFEQKKTGESIRTAILF